jgi:hypothetical protein
MPTPEQRPAIQRYQGEQFQADLSESETTFIAEVTNGAETVIFVYTPPGKVSVEIISSPALLEVAKASSAPLLTSAEQEDAAETAKTQKLYGRTATEPFHATAPSGEPMLIVSFAEHPSWQAESVSNAEPEKVKNDTRYWQAAAFGEHTSLLKDLPKGKASILIGYPKVITRVGKGGQEEVIKQGFQVVDRKPYLGTPKSSKG